MSDIQTRMLRSLETQEAARPLAQLIDDLLDTYPDPYRLASQHAASLLFKHTGKFIDPERVWWHQFTTASSSSRSFTGWQHSGSPVKSVRFTELIVQRFDPAFQDAPDELDLYGGLYKEGPEVGAYDENNEVPILAQDVRTDLWALDFAALYRTRIEQFWRTSEQYFRVLVKITLLGKVERASRTGLITQADREHLYTTSGVGLVPGQLPTLTQLNGDASLTGHQYTFGGQGRGGFYSFAMTGGRVLAFIPWLPDAVRGFESELAMAGWLRAQLSNAQTLAAFSLAACSLEQDPQLEVQVAMALRGIAAARSDQAALVLLSFSRKPLTTDVFTYDTNEAKAQMQRSADAMRSNAELRRSLLNGYLSAFLNVFGGLAPLGWPVVLTLLGATITKVGLDVDNALHSVDDLGRQGALRNAMLDSVFAAFNMVDLGFASSFATLAYQAPAHEVQAIPTRWEVSSSPSLILEGLELNELQPGELITSGRLRGVYVRTDGSCWIMMNGISYRVRFSLELRNWLIVPPDNPFAFAPTRPVRLNDAGEWELLVPPGLSGGQPPVEAGMASETSSFWDIYMQPNSTNKRQAFSGTALAAQKSLLLEKGNIPELAPGHAPNVDSHGLPCVMEGNTPNYTYRQGRNFYNCLIEYYTDEASQINLVFREGVYRHYDMNSYVEQLADSIAQLPKQTSAPLFRGGHGARNTSGAHFRSGRLTVGDVLVNTDLTSFTQNPYVVREFAAQMRHAPTGDLTAVFDDTSIVFELPVSQHRSGVPISAFAYHWNEAEVLFLPGNYFRIDKIRQLDGANYRFVHVLLSEVVPPADLPVYDLRTGDVFDRDAYITRLKSAELVDRFFPLKPA